MLQKEKKNWARFFASGIKRLSSIFMRSKDCHFCYFSLFLAISATSATSVTSVTSATSASNIDDSNETMSAAVKTLSAQCLGMIAR